MSLVSYITELGKKMRKLFLLEIFILFLFYCVLFSQQQNILKIRNLYLKGEIAEPQQVEDLKLEHPQEIIRNLILFEIYIDKKNAEEASKYYSYLQSFYPVSQLANYRMAEYYLSNKDLEEAKNYLQVCVKNDSRFHEARYLLAKTFYQLNDYQQAFKHYNVLSWFKSDKEIISTIDYLSSYLATNGNHIKKEKGILFSTIVSSQEINSPYIKVCISTKDNGKLKKIDAVKFFVSSDFFVLDERDKNLLECQGGENNEWTIVYRTKLRIFGVISPYLNKEYRVKSKILKLRPKTENSTFIIKEYKWFKSSFPLNKEFRGELLIKHLSNQIIVINNIKLDEYLYSVVGKEMGKDKPLEALKTQAVVARTVVLYRKNNKIHKDFDVCCGQHCQVYDGILSESETTIQAVNETLGEVITYNNKLTHPFFHANCGGITSSGEKFFCDKTYLSEVSDVVDNNFSISEENLYYWYLTPPELYCKDSQFVHLGVSRWLRVIKKNELEKYLNNKFKIGNKLKDIKILSREKNGHIKKLKIIGNKKTVEIKKEHIIRNIVPNGSLKSSSFIIEYNKNNDCYYFWGAGWGHAVGMCQSGSCGLAERGKNYVDIIKHYYPDVEIEKIY